MHAARQRPYRIEAATAAAPAIRLTETPARDVKLDRILDELASLRDEMANFQTRDPDAGRERNRNALWVGIESIQDAINNTKREIATLNAEGPRGERLLHATNDLETVVTDTECATGTILTAAELINAAVRRLMPKLEGDDLADANEIEAQIVKTFEACNFQDITGQRIRKVVDLLQFIEERVTRMTDIWGGAKMLAEAAGTARREGDQALLNGPARACDIDVVSQDEIDNLFS